MNSAYPNCTYELRKQGVPYPRTCAECGLGPCKAGHFVPAPKPVSEIDTLRAENAALRASRDELLAALKALDERLRACAKEPISAQEAYDSFYQEMVESAIAATTTGQPDHNTGTRR
jgi:hypothetical protein